MDDFSIKTRLTKKDYVQFAYRALYRKPVWIFAALLGLYLITSVLLDYLNIIHYYPTTPYYEIIGGVIMLAGPTLIVLVASRVSFSNPCFQHDITYTFGQDGIIVQGLTFKSELSWTHIIKLKETRKYLILYSSKKLGNFVDKSKLTDEQIEFIKVKVRLK